MQEERIKFETAKLAKEKGFNLEFCNTGWHGDFGDLELDNYPFLGTYSYYTSIYCNNKDEHQIQRPTQSLLQRWLRETHNIYVASYHDLTADGKRIQYYTNWGFIQPKGIEGKGGYDEYNEWKTYEEALEFGLLEGLKLI